MIKKILLPTDFSECAYYALKAAAHLAKKFNAELHLLHTVNMPNYEESFLQSGQMGILANEGALVGMGVIEGIDKRWDEITGQPFLRGVKVKTIVKFDTIYESIKEFSEEENVDIIVMGSHGASGFREYFGGSNTEKIVRIAKKPVLVIKEDSDVFKINDIVYSSNFYGEVEKSFETLRNLVETLGATLHLLKVITPDNFETTTYSYKVMESFAKKFKLKKYTINTFNEANVEDGIYGFCDISKPNMIAIATHGFTGIARLISGGSLAEDVVNHSKLPVLTFKIEHPNPDRKGVIFPDVVNKM